MAGWTTIADGTDAQMVLAAADKPGRYRLRIDLSPIDPSNVEALMRATRAVMTYFNYTMTTEASTLIVEWKQ